jgi:hypothetical protein
MRGPKPTPTAFKVLHGNPGQRRLNASEPIPKTPLLDPPAWFSQEQRAGWDYAIEHAPPGLLRGLDRSVFVTWVVAEDLHRQACLMQARVGLLTRVGKPPGHDADGNPLPDERALIQSPFLPIINKQAGLVMKAAAELGFSPASRTRVTGDPLPEPLPAGVTMGADKHRATSDRPAALETFLANPPPIPTMH